MAVDSALRVVEVAKMSRNLSPAPSSEGVSAQSAATTVPAVGGGAPSSSTMATVAVSNCVPSREAVTAISRVPSTVAFATALTVTATDDIPATSVTWWSAMFVSASSGLTV